MKEFIIPVYVKSEQELYSQFDPSGLILNSSLHEYLTDYLEDRSFMEKVNLELHSPDRPDMDRFKLAYDQFLEKLNSRNKKDMLKYTHESMKLLAIGAAFIALGLFITGQVNPVITTIVSTIGSFSVWEASAVWIKKLPSLRRRRFLLKYLSMAEIRFIEECP